MADRKSLKGGMKGYWRKRASNYSRLRRPPLSTVVLGSAADSATATTTTPAPRRHHRSWRIPRRIRFLRRIGSPKRWLARLRDAYVNMMLRLASSAPLGYGYGLGYGGANADVAFAPKRSKEYDDKMLVEIYKQLLVSQEPIVSAKPGVGCHRQILIQQ